MPGQSPDVALALDELGGPSFVFGHFRCVFSAVWASVATRRLDSLFSSQASWAPLRRSAESSMHLLSLTRIKAQLAKMSLTVFARAHKS